MKCQKCNRLFVQKGKRWCASCSSGMTLEQKIQAQRDHKALLEKRMEKIRLDYEKANAIFGGK